MPIYLFFNYNYKLYYYIINNMVEINYYSKYLKYKQKYLKQKNLQIGGEKINITIVVKTINLTPPPIFKVITFKDIEINDTEILKDNLDLFLYGKNIKIQSYAVDKLQKEKGTEGTEGTDGTDGTARTITNNLDLRKSFKELNIINNGVIIISEKKKIKINVVVKKIDKQVPLAYNQTTIESLFFNNTDSLYMIFKRLLDSSYLTGSIIDFKYSDFEILLEQKVLDGKKTFLENGINDNETITISEKKKIIILTIIIKGNSDVSYKDQQFDSTNKIVDAIQEWLISKKIDNIKKFSVDRKVNYISDGGSGFEEIKDINKTFYNLGFTPNGEELLITNK